MSSSRGKEPLVDENIDLAAKPQRPKGLYDVILRSIKAKVLKSPPIPKEKLHATYPVPPEFRAYDEIVGNFYKPKVVSIGPYHEEESLPMEDFKWTCLYELIDKHHPVDQSHEGLELLGSCFSRMIEREELIRKYYSKEIHLLGEKLAEMMLLDGGFILYLLLKEPNKIESETDDLQHIIGRARIWHLKYDLLLFENQIPFFVIRELCDILATDGRDINLVNCALSYFSSVDLSRTRKEDPCDIVEADVRHLLHLVYLSVRPSDPQHYRTSLDPQSEQWIPSVTELKESGVKFKKRKKANEGSFFSFLDIKFNDGVMEIPQLRLHDCTVSLLRNLVAFEQCSPDTECYITAYAALMHCLIDKEEDMRSLHLDQILVSKITTEEDATHLFKRLGNGIQCPPKKNYLGGLIDDVNRYHGRTWPQTRAYFVRTYFKNTVTTLVLIGGIIAFALSAFSNILSINRNLHYRN